MAEEQAREGFDQLIDNVLTYAAGEDERSLQEVAAVRPELRDTHKAMVASIQQQEVRFAMAMRAEELAGEAHALPAAMGRFVASRVLAARALGEEPEKSSTERVGGVYESEITLYKNLGIDTTDQPRVDFSKRNTLLRADTATSGYDRAQRRNIDLAVKQEPVFVIWATPNGDKDDIGDWLEENINLIEEKLGRDSDDLAIFKKAARALDKILKDTDFLATLEEDGIILTTDDVPGSLAIVVHKTHEFYRAVNEKLKKKYGTKAFLATACIAELQRLQIVNAATKTHE